MRGDHCLPRSHATRWRRRQHWHRNVQSTRVGDLGVTQLITVPWLLYGVSDDDVEKKCDSIRRFSDEFIR